MRFILLLAILSFTTLTNLQAQISNYWQEKANAPEPVTNNAVAYGFIENKPFIYSFSGMDSTKIWSGIHKKAFRYNVNENIWDTLPPLPSGEGRIAAAASTVKNKIYIIGGYDVFENDSEISYNNVHIFDPETNSYLPDGSPIPIPIDDHVQAVYRDSLIYVVTGWSNVNNVAAVQIYDTTTDTWLEGTSVPNSSPSEYKVFGASGGIVGDTLYYLGGARYGNNFPMTSALRKGYINPNDPTDITWSTEFDILAKGYRKGAAYFYKDDFFSTNNENNDADIMWIGGSKTSYNYNGIAYNGSGGVEPDTETVEICENKLCLNNFTGTSFNLPVMDIRNVVTYNQEAITTIIVVGGMLSGQKVSDKIFISDYAFIDNTNSIDVPKIKTFPNPAQDFIRFEGEANFNIRVFNTHGQLLLEKETTNHQLDVRSLQNGQYILEFYNQKTKVGLSKIIILR